MRDRSMECSKGSIAKSGLNQGVRSHIWYSKYFSSEQYARIPLFFNQRYAGKKRDLWKMSVNAESMLEQ